jgi:hypothetical protein
MFAYFKSEPTEYVLGYRNGRVFRQGAGKAFWYWRPSASIVLVPTATTDGLFVLNETTGNFQAVTLQGQITYRVVAPQILAGLLNYTIDPNTKQYLSEDPAKLQQRIVNIVQTHTRHELQQLSLEEALRSAEAIAQRVFERMRQDVTISALGVECLSLFYTAIKASPEMTKALEAEYRETLQKRADQAIYSRRADAVEQERKIKQNELSTSVDLEQRRQQLVELEGANARARAEFEAEATRIRLTPFKELEPRLVLALAFRDMAANAEKIGNLTITTEILEELLQARG